MKLHRRKKKFLKQKKKKLVKSCWSCKNWFISEVTREGRYCRKAGKEVFRENPACDHFKLHHHFWCRHRQCYVDVISCLGIRKNKRENRAGKFLSAPDYRKMYKSCRTGCPEGRLLELLVEKGGLPIKPGLPTPEPVKKKKLHRRKKTRKLMRRKKE